MVAVAEFVVRNTDSGSKTPFLKMPKAIFKKPAALLLNEPCAEMSMVLGIPPAAAFNFESHNWWLKIENGQSHP